MKAALLLFGAALCAGVHAIEETVDYETAILALEGKLHDIEFRVRERSRMLSQDPTALADKEQMLRAPNNVSSAHFRSFSQWDTTWWPYIGGCFAVICLILLVGAVQEVYETPGTKLSWANPVRMVTAYVRASDTLKQLCAYNPWTDPGQAPSANPYRLVAIVGPLTKNAIQGGEDLEGFKFTLPSKAGYVGILLMTTLTFVMQLYFPWKLVTGKLHGASFVFQGLKTVEYYSDNMAAVFLDLVPLTIMSSKFFVQVEDKVRSEFNQCLYLWRFLSKTEGTQAGTYVGVSKPWAWFWIAVSLSVNTYIAVLMTFYVVLSIATQSGDLMGFILSIFGSLGMIDFDDALLGALPEWTQWYAEHTCRCHPQGGHWAGASADFFGGPESVKDKESAREMGGIKEDNLVRSEAKTKELGHVIPKDGDMGNRWYWRRPKYVKIGIQLTNERPSLGFLFSGTTITSVSTSGAAARAVEMNVVEKGRKKDPVLNVPGADYFNWDDSHKKFSARAGKSQKGGPGDGDAQALSGFALGQPTEREGCFAFRSKEDNSKMGACRYGNYYGKRYPYLYCGKDFEYEKLDYKDAKREVFEREKLGFIDGTTKFDIGTDPVVKGRTVKGMVQARPWQSNNSLMKEQSPELDIDEDADYLLRGTGLEPGMSIWKINDKPVSTPDQIREELRALKGDCLSLETQRFDASKVAAVESTEFGKESFDNVAWNVKEFTMTVLVAGDEDSSIDDLFHSLFYTLIRILLLGSLLFIFCVYVTDSKGNHVGI